MASAFQQLTVVCCFALTLARTDSSSHADVWREALFEQPPVLQPAGATVVNTRNDGSEKVGRHLRPLERPPSPYESRPAERPGPMGQLRPMFGPEVPMERSRAMQMPEALFADHQQQFPQSGPAAEAGGPRTRMIPYAPKPGQCPVTECRGDMAITNKLDCMSDAQCPGSDKCCLDPCRRRLVCTSAGLHVHPGYCPAQESCFTSNYVYKVVCLDDVQCSSSNKCCYDQCIGLYVCKPIAGQPVWPPSPGPVRPPIDPVWPPSPGLVWPPSPGPVWPPSPGPVWPPIDPVWPPVTPNPVRPLPPGPDPSRPDKCSYYCPGSVRCCDHMMRPGFCPSSALCYDRQEESALTPYLRFCDSDFGCSRTDKCCFDQCHQRMICRTMVFDSKAHPGQCPAPTPRCEQAQVEAKTPCTDDRSCSLHERCCSSPCYRTLVCTSAINGLPQPPVVPPLPTPPPGPDPNQCVTYCPGTKRCCDGVEKNGFCPAPGKCVGAFIHAPKACTHDFDCEGGDKCCQDSCSTWKVCRTAVSSALVHPGVCPAPPNSCPQPLAQPRASQPQPNDCSQDMECTMEQRCCLDTCLWRNTCQFTNPPGPPSPPSPPAPPTPPPCQVYCQGSNVCCDEGEKIGFCPASASCVGALLNPPPRCIKDYDCAGAGKCCFDDCQKQYYCRPAVPHEAVHPGSCPPGPSSCVGYNVQNKKLCAQDSECRFEQRCCFDGCLSRHTCLWAIEEHSNTTTPVPPPPPPTPPTCSFYCAGTKVCCDNQPKVGYCPAASVCGGALINPPPSCLKDYECDDAGKCCFDDCQKQYYCRPAVPHEAVHPGSCPPGPSSCVGYNAHNKKLCAQDSECRFEQRCCFDGCLIRHTCLRAIEEHSNTTTPVPPPPPPTPPTCSFYCAGTKVCCDNQPKVGHCPAASVCGGALINPPPRCVNDHQCSGGDKCCSDHCERGQVCRAAMQTAGVHPGVCPTTQRPCLPSNIKFQPQCAFDYNCRFEQRCCYDHCHRKQICTSSAPLLHGCTIPCPYNTSTCCDNVDKPGFCPGISNCQHFATNISLVQLPTVCQGPDYSCPGKEKCCYDNCQRKQFCSPSVAKPNDHLGQCPLAQTSCIAIRPTNTPQCGNDTYCRSDEKCCADMCENKMICKEAPASAGSSS